MAPEWPLRSLAEISANFDSLRKPVREAERVAGPYPYYGASGIVDYVDGYLFDGEYLLVAEDGENLRTRNTPVAFRATGKFWVNNHAHILQGNGKASTRYLEYALLAADLTPYLTGAVMPKLTQGNLNRIELPCPPLKDQDEIVGVLGALDDRIDNLRLINATLEAIAQALFKFWFVDFDGVPPEEMQESELGLIPKGWRVATIGEVASVIDCLHAKKPELLAEGRPYLQLNCIRDDGLLESSSAACISDGDYAKWTSRIEVQAGDCVITNVGRVGALAQIPDGFKAAIGRNMTAIRPNSNFPPTFMIELLLSDFMRGEIDNKTDAGTILSALNVKSIPKLRFVLPEESILRRFEETARPLRAAMEANLQNSYTLTALRDTLLPRLISGRLRVGMSGRIAEQLA